MPSRTRPFLAQVGAVVTVAAAALTLAACGGDGKSSAKQPTGPVENQLGFDESGILARESRAEAVVRDCMKAQGFDYVPVDPLARRAAVVGSSRLSDEDFLKQFGYGISTLWGRGGVQADPNERLRASLSQADRAAYDRTLGGENPGATFERAVDRGDFTQLGGCRLQATERVFGGAQALTQLQQKLDALDDRILEDQRMVRALERWASCMTAAGYEYEDPEEIDRDLVERMEKIVGPIPGPLATGPAPGETPPPYDHAALQELQREEVAIARADSACEHKHITPVENVVRPQYEAQFRQRYESLIKQVKPVR